MLSCRKPEEQFLVFINHLFSINCSQPLFQPFEDYKRLIGCPISTLLLILRYNLKIISIKMQNGSLMDHTCPSFFRFYSS